MSRTLFTAALMDHYANPRHWGPLRRASVAVQEENPLCGDEVEVWLRLRRTAGRFVVEQASFRGQGCVLSLGAASLLCEELPGRTLAQVLRWGKREIFRLLGGQVGPARQSCALLALRAVQRGGREFLARRGKAQKEKKR